jgi:hypothetical protein
LSVYVPREAPALGDPGGAARGRPRRFAGEPVEELLIAKDAACRLCWSHAIAIVPELLLRLERWLDELAHRGLHGLHVPLALEADLDRAAANPARKPVAAVAKLGNHPAESGRIDEPTDP